MNAGTPKAPTPGTRKRGFHPGKAFAVLGVVIVLIMALFAAMMAHGRYVEQRDAPAKMAERGLRPVEQLNTIFHDDPGGGWVREAIDRSGGKDLGYNIDRGELLSIGIDYKGYRVSFIRGGSTVFFDKEGRDLSGMSLSLHDGKPAECSFYTDQGHAYDEAAVRKTGLTCTQASDIASAALNELLAVLAKNWKS